MGFVTIEDRVDRLEALFGQFLTEMGSETMELANAAVLEAETK